MSKCRACDATLTKVEGVWIEERKTHEDMCAKCLTIVREAEEDYNLLVLQEEDVDNIIEINNLTNYDVGGVK